VTHAEFRAKTDTALERYKQNRDTLEHQVRDLEAELKRAVESRRGAERALEMSTITLDDVHADMERVEQENEAMV
jgi:multidrug resistance efflux pump